MDKTKLFGMRWLGTGYKFHGYDNYVIYLMMDFGQRPPEMPLEITKDELEKYRPLFDKVHEYPRGGLFV